MVFAAALACVGLGSALSEGARRRRDARLFLISLAFVASAGFLALHALATPGVLLGPNGGFELATPVGLVLAGAFAAASAVELRPQTSARIMAAWAPVLGGLFVLLVAWGGVSIGELPPLDEPVSGEELDGWQLSLAAAGVVLYVAAAAGYARVYRRRRAGFLLAVTIALALLGEAMVVIAWARNWQLSWWHWHVLMLLAFVLIAASARRQWHEERVSALYLDDTLEGSRTSASSSRTSRASLRSRSATGRARSRRCSTPTSAESSP